MGLYRRTIKKDGVEKVLPVWWGQYRGERFSCKYENETQADKFFAKRLKEIDFKLNHPDEWAAQQQAKEVQSRTLGELIEQYMTAKGSKLVSARNLYQVKDGVVLGYAARLFDFFEKDTKISNIIPEKVIAYKTKRQADGLTACGINRELTMLQGAFKYAKAQKWVTVNPVIAANETDDIFESEIEQARSRFLTLKEEADLLREMPDWLEDIVTFLIHTGLRRSECLSLQWPNVDMNRRCFTVVKSKNGTKRTLPLDPEAMQVIIKRNNLEHCSTGHVFLTPANAPTARIKFLPCLLRPLRRPNSMGLIRYRVTRVCGSTTADTVLGAGGFKRAGMAIGYGRSLGMANAV